MLLGAAAGCGARAAPATSPAVADARTAVRVRTALVNDAVLGPLSIDVRVRDGIVTLRGTVRLPEEVDLALAVVRDVDGVARVESELGIGEPPRARPPCRRTGPAPGRSGSGRGGLRWPPARTAGRRG